MFNLILVLILAEFLGFGPKTRGGGGWSNSQGKSCKVDTLCLLEFLDKSFNLAKFHPNQRDSMYQPCLVLWWTNRLLIDMLIMTALPLPYRE